MTVCCKHNRCPDRPIYRLKRFLNRPWRCDQCGRLWVTKPVYSLLDTYWVWVEATR